MNTHIKLPRTSTLSELFAALKLFDYPQLDQLDVLSLGTNKKIKLER